MQDCCCDLKYTVKPINIWIIDTFCNFTSDVKSTVVLWKQSNVIKMQILGFDSTGFLQLYL